MRHIFIMTSCILLCSCASIVSGTSQSLAINTTPEGANCKLEREGTVIGRINPTPGSVLVQKTKHDIFVTCSKSGYQTARFTNHSGSEEATFGNIVLGGGIGWAIDSAAGADNKYSPVMNITLTK